MLPRLSYWLFRSAIGKTFDGRNMVVAALNRTFSNFFNELAEFLKSAKCLIAARNRPSVAGNDAYRSHKTQGTIESVPHAAISNARSGATMTSESGRNRNFNGRVLQSRSRIEVDRRGDQLGMRFTRFIRILSPVPAQKVQFTIMRLVKRVYTVQLFLSLSLAALGGTMAFALDVSATAKPPEATSDEIFRSAKQSFREGNTTSAIKLLEEAADLGHPGALWVLGEHYRRGDGVPASDLKAFQIFNEIANSHADDSPSSPQAPFVASAFVELGTYYSTGIKDGPVKPNLPEARRLLTYAASYFGDREAQFKLGQMLGDSSLPDHDTVQAARWLTLAARKGHVGAQALLGQLLFAGDADLPRKPLMGLMWLTIARSHANSAQDDWIRDLQEQAFSVAAEQDRRQAVHLAQEWIAKNSQP